MAGRSLTGQGRRLQITRRREFFFSIIIISVGSHACVFFLIFASPSSSFRPSIFLSPPSSPFSSMFYSDSHTSHAHTPKNGIHPSIFVPYNHRHLMHPSPESPPDTAPRSPPRRYRRAFPPTSITSRCTARCVRSGHRPSSPPTIRVPRIIPST
jgi:hypothetical protein